MFRDGAGGNGHFPGSREQRHPPVSLCSARGRGGSPVGGQGVALCLSCLAWAFRCRRLLAKGRVQLPKA